MNHEKHEKRKMKKYDYKKLKPKDPSEKKAPETDEFKKLQNKYIEHLFGKKA